ncbi:MAG: glycosyl hydrolase [Terriglobia bacterium]
MSNIGLRTQRLHAAATAVTLSLVLMVPVGAAQARPVDSAPVPVNPNASPEARALLQYLYSISGHYTLSGQHNYPNTVSRWTDRTYDLAGKYPAVFGQDFGFSADEDKDSTAGRPAMIEEVKRQYRNGAIITLTWHEVRPTVDEPVIFRENILSHLSDFEWSELLTPGSDLNKRWCAQVDVVAGFLKQLRDAHIPVLYRPYHEMNGNWFWWGGRKGETGSMALYRQIFDRFVNLHKLDNLIWVWNVNSPGAPPNGPGPFSDFFPGLQYADVLSVDIYGEFKASYYDDLLALAAGKPIALGEVGAVPSPSVLKQQPKWTWFMMWSELAEGANSLENLRAVFESPTVLNRDDPRVAGPMAAIRQASAAPSPELVTPQASEATKSLLARLYSVTGHNPLSGQANDPRSVSASTDHVFQITTKYPAVYGEDLGISKEAGVDVAAARQAIVEEAKRQSANHAIVSLAWHAARPTDDEPASWDQSVRGQLTDFEWNELLTPGTRLYQRWCAQVDGVAAYLSQLQDAHISVLWQPYPQANGKQFWWAGRKGIGGSAALYRQLFERLVNHDGLHNLVWVWEAAAPGFGPDAPGPYFDFFPGLLYADALAVDVENLSFGFPRDAGLALIGTGKLIGLGISGRLPDPAIFAQQTRWAWFLVSPEPPPAPDQSDALRKLYNDPRVVAR